MHPITTPRGYMARFWELVSSNQDSRRPHEDAFIRLEGELSSIHGVRRYRTFVSFRVGKHRGPKRAKLRSVESVLS